MYFHHTLIPNSKKQQRICLTKSNKIQQIITQPSISSNYQSRFQMGTTSTYIIFLYAIIQLRNMILKSQMLNEDPFLSGSLLNSVLDESNLPQENYASILPPKIWQHLRRYLLKMQSKCIFIYCTFHVGLAMLTQHFMLC